MATLSYLYSDSLRVRIPARVASVVVRPRGDGSFLALAKLCSDGGEFFVCYAQADSPDTALNRLADVVAKPERWRKDRLEDRF
jgi:hypothetical protein